MVAIGLTGGIGSGKSTIARIFEVIGIPVYYADERARQLMNDSGEVKDKLSGLFGKEIYTEGKLNRSILSSMVFNDPAKLELLNSVVHPITISDAEKWMKEQTSPYAIKEAALIFESGSQQHLYKVIGVHAPAPLRIRRVMTRDKVSLEEVKSRMDNQISEEIKMRLCDYVINNDEQELVVPQVLEIHQQILKEINNK